jgi:hypothetical protein
LILSDQEPGAAGADGAVSASGAAPAVHRINVVEPTLASEAGHCAALFRGLRAAAPDLAFRLWIDRRAQLPGWPEAAAQLEPLFDRRWRKLQALLLYRRLLRAPAPLLIPTATYFDLRALDLAAGGRLPAHRAFLYFHKLRVSPRRARALARLARRQPELELFGTSAEIVERLRAAGFPRVQRVLPVLTASDVPAAGAADAPLPAFRYLLSAGAARADKGFARIVDLVEWMARSGATLPIAVQTSGDHYGRHDERTAADLVRLRACRYAPLRLIDETLDGRQYAQIFAGAVCLQPYERAEYADKMSAVTFDALRAGAPVITLAGTTMAGIVASTGAGLVIEDASAAAMLAAAAVAVAQYGPLQARALAAAAAFDPGNSWAPLVERLRLGCAGGGNAGPAVRLKKK